MDRLEKIDIECWIKNFKKRNKLSDHRVSVEMNCIVSASTISKLLAPNKFVSDKSYERIKDWISSYEFENCK